MVTLYIQYISRNLKEVDTRASVLVTSEAIRIQEVLAW